MITDHLHDCLLIRSLQLVLRTVLHLAFSIRICRYVDIFSVLETEGMFTLTPLHFYPKVSTYKAQEMREEDQQDLHGAQLRKKNDHSWDRCVYRPNEGLSHSNFCVVDHGLCPKWVGLVVHHLGLWSAFILCEYRVRDS